MTENYRKDDDGTLLVSSPRLHAVAEGVFKVMVDACAPGGLPTNVAASVALTTVCDIMRIEYGPDVLDEVIAHINKLKEMPTSLIAPSPDEHKRKLN